MAHRLIPKGIKWVLFGRYRDESDLLLTGHAIAPAVPVGQTDVNSVATIIDAWVAATFAPLTHADIRFVRVVATAVDVIGGVDAEVAIDIPGAVSAPAILPAFCALSVKLNTPLTGRSHHGRLYMWPGSVGNFTGNKWKTDWVTSMVGAVDTLRTDLDTGGLPLAVGSPTLEKAFAVSDVLAVDSWIDVQRRRAGGRGR